MSDSDNYIRLPAHLLSDPATIVASGMHDDEQFAAHQVEFFRHLFARCAYLRAQSRETPSADAFLSAFVSLIDLLVANAPKEAEHCLEQLQQVLALTFPRHGGQSTSAPPVLSPIQDSGPTYAFEPFSSMPQTQEESRETTGSDPEESSS